MPDLNLDGLEYLCFESSKVSRHLYATVQNPMTGKHEQVTRHSFATTVDVVKQTCTGKYEISLIWICSLCILCIVFVCVQFVFFFVHIVHCLSLCSICSLCILCILFPCGQSEVWSKIEFLTYNSYLTSYGQNVQFWTFWTLLF
jgi:hypothetical protein